ncbi:MAG: serine O-acetyltransferase [Clostridia bacterium]|nr:serine O-acetyltransferase [Clostridia bacterium]
MREALKLDLDKIMQSDPAATSRRLVKRTYTGYKALVHYRYAHKLWQKGYKRLAFYVSYRVKVRTGIDIHPAAEIGNRIFIDHGVGLVIGETSVVGDDCVLYQGVTLGGTGKDCGKRHPTLEKGVMVSAGASILGPVTIGEHSKIGAGSVVLKDIPPHSTVVGVPGRVVRQNGKKVEDEMSQALPDPILEELARINKRLSALEDKEGINCCQYSLSIDKDNALSETAHLGE